MSRSSHTRSQARQSGIGEFAAPLGVLPALDVFEIQLVGRSRVPDCIKICFENGQIGRAAEKFDDLGEVIYRAYGKRRTEDRAMGVGQNGAVLT